MKKKILIISGGISKERAISLDTGKQVAKELAKNNYIVKIIEPNFGLFEKIKKFKPNIIFNALHGQFGEDGYIQTILETTGVPYTHSGVTASAIAIAAGAESLVLWFVRQPRYSTLRKWCRISIPIGKTVGMR